MEGPTPVSALIHAATMVTAGVFLIARCSPIYEHTPSMLVIITIVGASTAFFAASVGLVQNDIKRIIAYSTCSQLGYMVFTCGLSNYSVGVFHILCLSKTNSLIILFIALDNLFGYINENRIGICVFKYPSLLYRSVL